MKISDIKWITVCVLLSAKIVVASSGYFLHGFGPVNEALGGAATAGNPDDVIGSLSNNPANALLFEGNQAQFSFGAILPDVTVNSTIEALGLSGSSDSTVDVIPISNTAMVFRPGNVETAYYIALVAEAGLHMKVPASQTNPVFFPQPFGFGNIESQLEVVRIPMGMSYQIDNKLTLGFAIGLSVARNKFTPAGFAAADDANGDGYPSYPTDVDHDVVFGVGMQVGLRYQISERSMIGCSLTTPSWFENFKWKTKDEAGDPRNVSLSMDRPLTVKVGMTYETEACTLLLLDLGWINYADTSGFDETGLGSNGELKGLGFNNMVTVALGLQHRINERLTLRAGYNYGKNPIDASVLFYNVASPLVSEHHVSFGMSWKTGESLSVDLSYTHAFGNSVTGPLYSGNVAIPGSGITGKLSYDQITAGVTFQF